jgi:hypothetical protein
MVDRRQITKPDFRRRRLAATAGGAVAFALLAARSGAVRANKDPALVGSCMVGTPTGAQPGPPRILVSFTGDGVALRTAPLQQAAPPALGVDKMFVSTTHGAWAQMNDGTFGMTWTGFAFDAAGTFLATQQVRVGVEVNEAQDAFMGPFKTDFVSAEGQILASVSGTVQGTRIQVQQMA